jgi:hypothetical protein
VSARKPTSGNRIYRRRVSRRHQITYFDPADKTAILPSDPEMNMRTATMILTFTALAVAAASAPAAEDTKKGDGSAVRAACQADVQKLCPNIQPGDGRIKHCMRENRASVSDQCKAAMKEAHRERQQSAPPPTKGSG